VESRRPLPALRPLDVKRIPHDGGVYLMLRDPLELAGPDPLLAPAALGPLLAMLDGTRDAGRIAVELLVRYGINVHAGDVERFVHQLSAAYLLDDEVSRAARRRALADYHAAPFRAPALAGRVYPADAEALGEMCRAFEADERRPSTPASAVAGVISPHIDYQRGGPVYARLWQEARAAARAAEVVVVFGTDHSGGRDRITLTHQDYATPWGPLPTDARAHEAMVDALGASAFDEELHHRAEHSVELATVWLHYARDGEPAPLVPVLCGHPGASMAAGRIAPETPAGRAIAALRSALAGRRALVVAAADLAHVGPAFGDPAPFGARERALVRAADEELITAAAEGAAAVLHSAGRIDDRYRICGLGPIACMLELIGPAEPETLIYEQCPADADGGSFVSIAGVLLRPRGASQMADGGLRITE
jgi:AmmeMemoRadiSam system protein B